MKKYSIRYSNRGIAILISTLLILANVFIFTAKIKPIIPEINQENLEKDIYDYLIFNDVNSSLKLNGLADNGKKDGIRYFTNYKVIDNYILTEEYKENYPDDIIAQTYEGEIHYLPDKEALDSLKSILGEDLETNENTKDPIILENISTNSKDYLNENIYSIKNKIQNPYLYIRTEFNNNPNIEIGNKEKLKDFEQRILDQVIKQIEDSGEVTKYDQTKLISMEGIYEITPGLANIEKISEVLYRNAMYFINMIYAAILILIILGTIVTLTNYNESKDISFYKWIKSIPIEVYGFLTLMFLISSSLIVKESIVNLNYYYDMFGQNIYHLIFGATIFLLIEIIAIYYFIMWFKSIYHEGFNNFMFENSIIIRFVKYIISLFKRFVTKSYNLMIGENLNSKLMWLGLFFLLFLIFIFGNSFGKSILLFAILLTAAYFIISKIINDYNELENGLEEISEGNFSIRIDEKNPSFSKMAKDINNLGSSLEKALQKELQSERMKTELITNVSHDLKTPLTSIINYSDLAMREDASDEDIKKYIKTINEKSLKLKTLIENLFEVAKVNSNNIELNKMNIDIVQMLSQTIGEWSDEFSSRNIEAILNSNEDSIILNLDGEQTYRIFDNVFSNISKYAQDNTRVYIDVLKSENKSKITIKNVSKYSLNISAQELRERFIRGDESRNTEGSGLGLAIATSLTEIQGGKFDIEIDGDLFKVIIEFNN